MKNIWSTHTLCLDWLHKCTILCNPDLRFCFSLFWSITYFPFNHTGQTAGWFPGAVSQMANFVAWPVGTGQPATTSLFLQERLVSFLPPYPWSWAALARANRPAVEGGEVLPQAQWAGWGSVFSSLTSCAIPIGQCRLASRQGRADNPHPPAPGKSVCPVTLAGDHPPEGSSTMHHGSRSSAQDFWWLCSRRPLWCASGKSLKRAFHQAVFSAPKWAGFLNGEVVKSSRAENSSTAHWLSTRHLKIKFSTSSSLSSAFN